MSNGNNGQNLTWTGSAGDDNWADAANWENGVAPASAAPGASDAATIVSASLATIALFGSDPGQADSLTLGGANEFQSGTFEFGTVTEEAGATTTIDQGVTLGATGSYTEGQNGDIESYGSVNIGGPLVESAGHLITVWNGAFTVGSVTPDVTNSGATDDINGGAFTVTGAFAGVNGTINAAGGAFTVAGTATVNGDIFSASNSSAITLTNVASANSANTFNVFDANSDIELGGVKDALAGQFVLDKGQTLSGGGEILAPEIVINGVLEVQGGASEQLDGAIFGSGSFQIGANGDLTLDNAVDASATLSVAFSGAGGELSLNAAAYDANGGFAPVVTGFQSNDTIELIGFSGDGSGLNAGILKSVAVHGGNTVLTVSGFDVNDVAVSDTLTFKGLAFDSLNDFQVQFDGSGGTFVTTSVTCFCPGTLIRTPDGEAAVEDLRRGDLVLTSAGESRPVSWIGVRAIATRFADPLRCWPIRVKAGALDENVPARDLLLSPDHALLVGGVLIHAGALVNGVSILRETEVSELFTYYHVELDDHALILAENAPAETFVDNVDRLGFDNWAEHEALWPEGKPIVEMPYPRAKAHRQVPAAVRALIAARAQVANPATAAA